MKKILIASTYYENVSMPDVNKLWRRLQKEFIDKNTSDYDIAVYLHRITKPELYDDCIIIGENIDPPVNSRISHRMALTEIIRYFREHQDEYHNFCILDSDCFPIRKGWVGELNTQIYNNGLKFAAIMRVENGETFPHPAAMFIPREYIGEDLFNFDYEDIDNEPPYINILDGSEIRDTGSGCNFWCDGSLVGHPILRTNAVNVHPIFAGIYGDLFYHHGCGSRMNKKYGAITEPGRSFRAKPYWEVNGKNFAKGNASDRVIWLFDFIRKNPQKFIDTLRGITMFTSPKFNPTTEEQQKFWNWFKPFNPHQ